MTMDYDLTPRTRRNPSGWLTRGPRYPQDLHMGSHGATRARWSTRRRRGRSPPASRLRARPPQHHSGLPSHPHEVEDPYWVMSGLDITPRVRFLVLRDSTRLGHSHDDRLLPGGWTSGLPKADAKGEDCARWKAGTRRTTRHDEFRSRIVSGYRGTFPVHPGTQRMPSEKDEVMAAARPIYGTRIALGWRWLTDSIPNTDIAAFAPAWRLPGTQTIGADGKDRFGVSSQEHD